MHYGLDRWSSRSLIVVLLSVALLVGVVAGFTFQKYQFFPYRELRAIARSLDATLSTSESLDFQYSVDPEHLALGRELDTSLVPLSVRGVRLSEEHPFPKGGGAIASIGASIIILDRLGNFYAYGPGREEVEKLSIPALPNNVDEYLRFAGTAGVSDRHFRAYDVLYMPSRKVIAVSHELFDRRVNATRFAVSLVSIDEETLEPEGAWSTVFQADEQPNGPNERGGGALAANGPDKLYVAVGDYGMDGESGVNMVVDPTSTFGKIFEVDLASGTRRLFTRGHRNQQGMVLLESGEIIEVEQGPHGGDEVNILRSGHNYGWPTVSLGTHYGSYGLSDAPGGDHSGYTPPLFSWMPSISVSSVIQVLRFDTRWRGDVLAGSLKAQSLFRLRIVDGRVLYAEPIFLGQRIRDVAESADGTLAVWTDDAQLLLLAVAEERLSNDARSGPLTGDVIEGQCLYCHHFGPTSGAAFAPSLSGLFERRIASDNFRYSEALRSIGGVWTEESLKSFLRDPSAFANGTAMPRRDLTDEQLDEVIDILRSASGPRSSSSQSTPGVRSAP